MLLLGDDLSLNGNQMIVWKWCFWSETSCFCVDMTCFCLEMTCFCLEVQCFCLGVGCFCLEMTCFSSGMKSWTLFGNRISPFGNGTSPLGLACFCSGMTCFCLERHGVVPHVSVLSFWKWHLAVWDYMFLFGNDMLLFGKTWLCPEMMYVSHGQTRGVKMAWPFGSLVRLVGHVRYVMFRLY